MAGLRPSWIESSSGVDPRHDECSRRDAGSRIIGAARQVGLAIQHPIHAAGPRRASRCSGDRIEGLPSDHRHALSAAMRAAHSDGGVHAVGTIHLGGHRAEDEPAAPVFWNTGGRHRRSGRSTTDRMRNGVREYGSRYCRGFRAARPVRRSARARSVCSGNTPHTMMFLHHGKEVGHSVSRQHGHSHSHPNRHQRAYRLVQRPAAPGRLCQRDADQRVRRGHFAPEQLPAKTTASAHRHRHIGIGAGRRLRYGSRRRRTVSTLWRCIPTPRRGRSRARCLAAR